MRTNDARLSPSVREGLDGDVLLKRLGGGLGVLLDLGEEPLTRLPASVRSVVLGRRAC